MKKVKYQYKKNKKMDIVPLNKVTEYDLVRKGISGPRWRKRLQLHDNVAKRVYANYAKECFLLDFPTCSIGEFFN